MKNLLRNMLGMVPQGILPKAGKLPKGLGHRYVKLAVLAKLSDNLAVEVVGGRPIVMVYDLPMPLRVFLLSLGSRMALGNYETKAISRAEDELLSFWMESGVPEQYHTKAARDGWGTVEHVVGKLLSEWRDAPDPIQTFSDTIKHLDDLYAMALARSEEDAAMAEATLSSGIS